MQMDFLSAIPDAAKPMPPVGPGPDGTPPLPLINKPDPVPPRPVFPLFTTTPIPEEGPDMSKPTQNDVFDSDPFFNPETTPETPEEPTLAPEETALVSDDISFDVAEFEAPESEPPQPVATAEERLLNTIVREPEAAKPEPPPHEFSSEVAALQAELEKALARADSAVTARNQARQDLQILKTRFSSLESDLASLREETAKANQLKEQAETRHTDSERQWNDKLAQLRRMLDEVEEIRDEQLRKRVPKILFTGTLLAGVLATAFAYFIGAGQTTRETHSEPPPPPPLPAAPIPPPIPAIVPPAPAIAPPQVLQPANWPTLTSTRWKTTETDKELKLIFNEGLFTRGVELSSEAKQDLKAIATAIKAKGNRFRIEVIGHTDSTKASGNTRSSNNKALGLARAKAAAGTLIKAGELPASAITTSSAGEDNPPYPNTTPENQKKNRTVVLKITASSVRSP